MKKPKIGIITQARMSSSRLAGKVLLPLGKQSVLEHHLHRLKQANLPVFVATVAEEGGEKIAQIAKEAADGFFLGSLDDVLSRFLGCAQTYELDYIVRVTSDCPLIDPQLILQGVELLPDENPSQVYISNTLQRTYPRGFDFELFSYSLLKLAHEKAQSPTQREHVTPYLYSGQDPQIHIIQLQDKSNNSDLRITLDTPEDLRLLKILIEQHQANLLSHQQITEILRANPALIAINAEVEQKKI